MGKSIYLTQKPKKRSFLQQKIDVLTLITFNVHIVDSISRPKNVQKYVENAILDNLRYWTQYNGNPVESLFQSTGNIRRQEKRGQTETMSLFVNRYPAVP